MWIYVYILIIITIICYLIYRYYKKKITYKNIIIMVGALIIISIFIIYMNYIFKKPKSLSLLSIPDLNKDLISLPKKFTQVY